MFIGNKKETTGLLQERKRTEIKQINLQLCLYIVCFLDEVFVSFYFIFFMYHNNFSQQRVDYRNLSGGENRKHWDAPEWFYNKHTHTHTVNKHMSVW